MQKKNDQGKDFTRKVMRKVAASPSLHTVSKTNSPGNSHVTLQRKCACGGSSALGECEECKKKRLQTKLSIGTSNDPLEREADRVADQVMTMLPNSGVSNAPPRIQRFTGQASGEVSVAPASIDRVLSGTGRPLDPALQQDMGNRFGYDFSQVRVHTGSAAEQSARDVNADAYTVGNNIVFGAGRFEPTTNEGRTLLAHELTHTVQQASGLAAAHGSVIHSLQRQAHGSPPVSVRSPAAEELVTQVSTVAAAVGGRPLSAAETNLVRGIFGNSIDYSNVRLIPTQLLEYRTVGNAIRVPENFSISNDYMAETLVHEMTHVWQYQHGGTGYISVSLVTQIAGAITTGSRNAAYDYNIAASSTFFDFMPEQQAKLVQNYFAMLRDQNPPVRSSYLSNHLDASGNYQALSAVDRRAEISRELPQHERLIRQMQASLPRSEASLLMMRAGEVMRIPGQDIFPVPTDRTLIPIKPVFEVRF